MKNHNLKFSFRFLTRVFSFSLLIFILMLARPTMASPASFYFSPSGGTYYLGNTFSVAVRVNTGGVAINAAQGTLSFNNKLEVVSLSKSGSIFGLWVPPYLTFSNSTRTIKFGGGSTTPFKGLGTMFIINFRAKSVGNGTVKFTSGQLLSYGPSPRNILSSTGSGTYTISTVPPGAPKITSPTHPNQNQWYKNNDPKFAWKLYSGVSSVSFSFNQQSISYPDSITEGLLTSTSYKDAKDGVWYFHLKFYSKGVWGPSAHYKVQIDTTPPEHFEVVVDNGGDPTNPQPVLLFHTTDIPSGIDYYEIKIGEKDSVKVRETSYKVPVQNPRKRTVIVKAVDKAGNYTLEMAEMVIESIEAPVITDYPRTLYLGDPFWLKGESFPGATIHIYLQKEGEEGIFRTKVKSDKKGNFSYDHDRLLERGRYNVWAVAEDFRGAKSNPSEKITVTVGPCAFIRIGPFTLNYFVAVIILLVLILFLILLIWRIFEKIKETRKRLKKEVTEAEEALYKAFTALKDELKEQIEKFDKMPGLSPKEKEIYDALKKALEISEKFIGKEVEEIKDILEKKLLKDNFFKREKK